jgi:hypothetical protein
VGWSAGPRARVLTAAGRRLRHAVEPFVELSHPRSYRVDSIERFDRRALPAELFARTGPERLRLVTCTGPYVVEAGGYQQNLVITAVPV